MDFKFDGKSLINSLLLAESKKKNDIKTANLITTFQKYGLNFIDGMALVMEIASIFNIEGDENDG